MIKKIDIKNIAGITGQEISFLNSNAKKKATNEPFYDGMIWNFDKKERNTTKLLLFPTFVATNASGKSSMLKAVKLSSAVSDADMFISVIREDFRKEKKWNKALMYDKNFVNEWLKSYMKDGYDRSCVEVTYANPSNVTEDTKREAELVNVNGAVTINIKTSLENISKHEASIFAAEIKEASDSERGNGVATFSLTPERIIELTDWNITKNTIYEISSDEGEYDANEKYFDNFEYISKPIFCKILSILDKNWKYSNGKIFQVRRKFNEETLEVETFRKEYSFDAVGKYLSNGTKKMLSIINKFAKATIDFKMGDSPIFIIDEIENGLNIALIELIFSTVKALAHDGYYIQVFSTTHATTIFEKNLVSPWNAFVSANRTNDEETQVEFINLLSGDLEFKDQEVSRPEKRVSAIKLKNYFSPVFWEEIINEDKMFVKTRTLHEMEIDNLSDFIKSAVSSDEEDEE